MTSIEQDNNLNTADRYPQEAPKPAASHQNGTPYHGHTSDTGIDMKTNGTTNNPAEKAYPGVSPYQGHRDNDAGHGIDNKNTPHSAVKPYSGVTDSDDSGTENLYKPPVEGCPVGGNRKRASGGDITTGSDEGGLVGDNRRHEIRGAEPSLMGKVVGKTQRAFEGSNRSESVTGVKLTMSDRIVGSAQRAFGGNTTTGSETDNHHGHPSHGHPDEGHPPGGNRSNQAVTGVEPRGYGTDNHHGHPDEGCPPGGNRSNQGTGVKPTTKDKIIGAFGGQGNSTTHSGNDNQNTEPRGYGTDNHRGHPDEGCPPGGNRSNQGTGVEPTMKDKIIGAFGGHGNSTTHSGNDNQNTSNGRPDEGKQARDTDVNPTMKNRIVNKADRVVDNLKDKV